MIVRKDHDGERAEWERELSGEVGGRGLEERMILKLCLLHNCLFAAAQRRPLRGMGASAALLKDAKERRVAWGRGGGLAQQLFSSVGLLSRHVVKAVDRFRLHLFLLPFAYALGTSCIHYRKRLDISASERVACSTAANYVDGGQAPAGGKRQGKLNK